MSARVEQWFGGFRHAIGPRVLLAVLILAVVDPAGSGAARASPDRLDAVARTESRRVAPAPSDPKAWPEKLTQKWKVEVGSGYATPLVVGNRIYQFSRQGEREVMSALDADTGKVLWQTGHDAPFTMHSATTQHGPGRSRRRRLPTGGCTRSG